MAIHRYSLNRMIFVPCFVVLLQTAGFSQPAVWNNPGTGPAAGNWSSASNWSPAGVPTSANSAQIRNGGESRITNSIAASRIEVGKNGGVGKFTSVSSGIEILVDSDFEIGEIGGSFATGPVVVTSSGSASISNATQLLVGNSGSGDLDIGQTNATSGAQANGLGSLTLDAITLVEVLDDVDVGQAGGSAIANANGTLLVSSVGDFRIGADLDVGQSGGTGQSAAFGLATFENSQVTMGADADVGRTTGSVGGNSGDGTLSATDSTLSIGFADALLPGSLNIGDASTLQFQRATALGGVTFERTTLAVADRINIGGISGGGTNSLTSARGSLTLIDSFAAASIVDVAVIADNTAGTATGRLQLDASLLTVGGMLGLGTGATLSFEISGTTRANGTVATDQYGAINALSATLAGNLEILLAGGFTPAAGDQFDLISTTGMLTQSFSTSSLPSLSTGLSWNLTQMANLLQLEVLSASFDGDFDADGNIDGGDFLAWQRGLGIPSGASKTQGDADLDGDVDQADLLIWESTFGTVPNTQALNVVSLNGASAVPEPGTFTLVAVLLVSFVGFTPSQKRSSFHLCAGRLQ